MKWEPIESAPAGPLDEYRYGPEILLWVDGRVGIGFWDDDFNNFYVEFPWHRDHVQPSHWMPVPLAPADIQSASQAPAESATPDANTGLAKDAVRSVATD